MNNSLVEYLPIFTTIFSIYLLVFLVGGAIYSALKYAKHQNQQIKLKRNIIIAIGVIT